MSELKAYYVPTRSGNSCHCYIKDEADKVIAEKDKELRHQKYKRCLAMAKWCDAQVEWYNSLNEDYSFWLDLYVKWSNRWLKIAEQFKEAK